MKVRIIARFKNENFHEARIRAGLTQQSLADLIGISMATIVHYENFGAYPIAPDNKSGRGKRFSWIAEKIEKILKTPYEVLFPEEYRRAIDKKLGKPIHAIQEFLELPESYVEKNLTLPDPADIYDMKELKEKVGDTLALLTGREARVLKMRFGLGGGDEYSLVEVGRQLKVTHERIRQIEAKALRKLKHPYLGRKLKPFQGGK